VEAYFEVTHDVAKKFLVDANGVTTEVLGTHFNVNAYSDEEAVKVTLLQGSVRVTTPGNKNIIIKPGQQALSADGKLLANNSINIEEVMAWKNGMFKFNRTDLREIMRQIARWYDVEVSYASASHRSCTTVMYQEQRTCRKC
jgi:ferric-dicitrate binding protein FerR (iron transport regulator)